MKICFLECPIYASIISQFQNIFNNIDLPTLLIDQKNGDLRNNFSNILSISIKL